MKRILTAGAVALALLTPGALLAPTALAHSELVSSDPADGATLDSPPTTVSFTFSEPLMPDFVRIIGTNPEGVTGDLPVSSVEGPTATVDWPAGAQGGTWQVSYRVVSQDGHPIEGGITFTYDISATDLRGAVAIDEPGRRHQRWHVRTAHRRIRGGCDRHHRHRDRPGRTSAGLVRGCRP